MICEPAEGLFGGQLFIGRRTLFSAAIHLSSALSESVDGGCFSPAAHLELQVLRFIGEERFGRSTGKVLLFIGRSERWREEELKSEFHLSSKQRGDRVRKLSCRGRDSASSSSNSISSSVAMAELRNRRIAGYEYGGELGLD